MSISFISENDGFNLPAIEQYLDESIKMQQWSNDTRFLED
jgi:ATP-dependent RNA helicase RhlB